jgi:VWFA-related protein
VHPLFFDAVVTGADGHPVPGLSAQDFELTQAGAPRKIASMAWFDNRQYGPAAKPAFEISPDDVRRKIVLVVDDLGLAPDRVAALQNVLRLFIEHLAPDAYAALLRTSSNTGGLDLNGDRGALAGEIEQIQPAGRGLDSAAIAAASWESIRSAVDGLHSVPGRKSIILVSEHLDSPYVPAAGQEYVRTMMGIAAHAAMTVFYTVDPRAAVQPPEGSSLARLVKETGGLPASDLDAVLRDQEGFYVLGFHPAQESASPAPPVLRLNGKVLNLRWRFGYVNSTNSRSQEFAPPDRAAVVQRALAGSGDAGAIRTRVTPLFTGFTRAGAIVEVLVHIDARNLSSLRDLKGAHHLSAEVQLAPYGSSGKLMGPTPQTYNITVDDKGYEQLKREGLRYSARLALSSPGGYQIRAVVTDGLSDRTGSATQFVEIPAINQGRFAISGLLLRKVEPPKPTDKSAQSPNVQAAETVFNGNAPIAFSYSVFNATAGPARESRLQLVTRVYASGRKIYQGRPVDLMFPGAGAIRQVNSRLQFDENLAPGNYLLEVEATDALAKDPQPHLAIQSAAFQVRE